jgi:hypothetical protein
MRQPEGAAKHAKFLDQALDFFGNLQSSIAGLRRFYLPQRNRHTAITLMLARNSFDKIDSLTSQAQYRQPGILIGLNKSPQGNAAFGPSLMRAGSRIAPDSAG